LVEIKTTMGIGFSSILLKLEQSLK